jgi:hypothetical protein
MSNMRTFINLVETTFLTEANVVGIKDDFEITYYNKNDKLVSFNEPSFKEQVSQGIKDYTTNNFVMNWFESVFVNWIANGAPGSQGDFFWNLDDYLDYALDFVYSGDDDYFEPSDVRYSSDINDRRIIDDIKSRLPSYVKNAKIIKNAEYILNNEFPAADVVDWMTSDQGRQYLPKLQKMSVMDVLDKTTAWQKIKLKYTDEVEGIDFKIISSFDDGFKIVQLLTPKSLDNETCYMNHCVGKGSYDEKLEEGKIKIYSLRDERNNPMATIEVENDTVKQVKGKQNKNVDETVHLHLYKFILKNKLRLIRDFDKIGL